LFINVLQTYVYLCKFCPDFQFTPNYRYEILISDDFLRQTDLTPSQKFMRLKRLKTAFFGHHPTPSEFFKKSHFNTVRREKFSNFALR